MVLEILTSLTAFGLWIIPLLIWTVVWKAIALWRAARNGHKIWFIVMLVINTVGILPIIYIVFFSKKKVVIKKKKR